LSLAVHVTVWSVALQDEHLINHFVRSDLLKPIVDAFVANGNRYNLLNSAVLELFEYIRKVSIFYMYSFFITSSSFELIILYNAGEYEIIAEVYS